MADKPASPFANLGLDKALLRSSQQPPAPVEPASKAEEAPAKKADAPKRERVHARTDAQTDGCTREPSIEHLYRQLQTKQHLASQTFRFHPEELAALDRVSSTLKGPGTRSSSKNDLVRLGLNWLLADYEQNGEESVLARVRARM